MAACRVFGCGFLHTHVTRGHRCGRCGAFGHGVTECRDDAKKNALRAHDADTLPADRRCRVPGCRFAWSHALEAHHCSVCHARGGGGTGCAHCAVADPAPLPRLVACPMCRVESADPTTVVFTGADCVVCMAPAPCVLFDVCRHATVCRECVARL